MIGPATVTAEEARAWRPEIPDVFNSADIQLFYSGTIPQLGPMEPMVEVGVGYGRSLLWAHELRRQRCHLGATLGVDNFGEDFRRWSKVAVPCRCHLQWSALVKRMAGTVDRPPLLMTCASLEAAELFEDGELGLVMIDASHELPDLVADIAAWRRKVRRGGIIAGHDWCDEWPGVREAVVDQLGGSVQLFGTVWAFEL